VCRWYQTSRREGREREEEEEEGDLTAWGKEAFLASQSDTFGCFVV
jgi:hypothetical protein